MYLPPYLSLWPAAQDSRCFWHSGCPRIQGQGGSLQPVDPMYQQIIPLLICAFYNFPWYFPHGQVLHNGCLWANSLLLFFYFWPHSRQLNIPWPGVKPTPQQWPDSQQWQPKILNPLSHQGTPIFNYFFFFLFFFFFFFLLFRAASVAHGRSQARGWIGAVAAGLYHCHSHLGSKPRLWPTPQLTAIPDP